MNKSIKNAFFIILIGTLFYQNLFADEPPKESNKGRLYQVLPVHVISGYSASYVKKGYIIGEMLTIELPKQQSESTKSATFSGIMIAFKEAEEYKQELITKERNNATKNFSSLETNLHNTSAGSEAPNHVSLEDQPGFNPDIKALHACAKDTLPLLKKLRRVMVFSSETYLMSSAVLEEINNSRGVNSQGEPTGFPCGKYFGKTAIQSTSWIEEVKTLSAFASREDKELETLLRAFIVSYHPDAPLLSKPLWIYFWKHLSLLSVFSKAPLPTFETLVNDYTAGKTITNGVTLAIDPNITNEYYKMGLNFLENKK